MAWLCSEEAGWVTGQVIHSEGGFRAAESRRTAPKGVASRDGDRHPHERAQAALVVGDVDLPDPCRAAAVAAAGLGVDRAAGDRAQEAVWLDMPCAALPSGQTAMAVAIEVIDSAIEA